MPLVRHGWVPRGRGNCRGNCDQAHAKPGAKVRADRPLTQISFPRSSPSLNRPPARLPRSAVPASRASRQAQPLSRGPAPAGLYEELARDVAALPVVAGRLPSSASMPGAATSFTLQALVGGGRSVEVRTGDCRPGLPDT